MQIIGSILCKTQSFGRICVSGSDDQNRNAVPSGGSRGDVVSIADPQSNVTQPDVTKTHPTSSVTTTDSTSGLMTTNPLVTDSPSTSACKTTNSKPFSNEECLQLVKALFDGSENRVHNRYLCLEKFCTDISDTEKKRLLPKKFNHGKLSDYWWLCFLEGEGMFCVVCKKHSMKHRLNKRDIFVNKPGTRFLEDALKGHSSSDTHKAAIETEMVHKQSFFHKEVCQKKNVETSLYEKVFSTAYFLMKNFMPVRKLLPVLSMIENVYDYQNLKYFDHKSVGSQRVFLNIRCNCERVCDGKGKEKCCVRYIVR